MNIGKRIKFFRNIRNLSREELSKMTGISKTALYYYENNRRKPGFEALEKITDALNITLEELISSNEFRDFDYINNNTRNKIKDGYSEDMIDFFEKILEQGYKNIDESSDKEIEKNIEKILFSTIANIISTEELSNSIEYKLADFNYKDLKEISDFLFNIYKLKIKEILTRSFNLFLINKIKKSPFINKKLK